MAESTSALITAELLPTVPESSTVSSSSQSAAVVEEDTASVLSCGSTLPGVEGEIVPLPSVSVTVGDRTVVIVEVEPRVDVPKGEVQAGPAAVLVTQADSQPASCSGVGKWRSKIKLKLSQLVTHLEPREIMLEP